uniref:Uncharacterized protein n=1 Tax=Arabidopsis thaliana TaxID=3702 RepID=Q681D5_ARATH|nr:unnamed protein product [Arabidopsis thaliana]BAD43445.1 unnamed protein product [Arabidopsis thaliana]BAD43756.1 unnamed protein product [Arabidopsis thaliana]BAD43830.1 unnamed protein product [Arabidopsis thaliana]BAD44239.1 unnamed protein product [Arabidopsis thaliana]
MLIYTQKPIISRVCNQYGAVGDYKSSCPTTSRVKSGTHIHIKSNS